MKLMIELPDETYRAITDKLDTFPSEWRKWGLNAIAEGTVVPEHNLSDEEKAMTAKQTLAEIREGMKRAEADMDAKGFLYPFGEPNIVEPEEAEIE